jgi:oxygen-dependent protoporphyrinogen oxidase
VLVRAMVGRYGDRRFTALTDAELVERVHAELALTMGLTAAPKEATVQRWPRAMPQYTVGHQARLERIDSDLANLPGLVVTGAAYRGVGVASCVSQGERTATDLLAWLDAARTHSEGPS